MLNKILITGANGYVGNYVLLRLAKQYPQAQIIGMSRRGTPRTPEIMKDYPNVTYEKGDCLDVESFKHLLPGVTGCIHTVGTLIGSKTYEKSYQAMNCDTAINVAS